MPSAPTTHWARNVRWTPDASVYRTPRTRPSSRTRPLTRQPHRSVARLGRRRASTEITPVRSTTTRNGCDGEVERLGVLDQVLGVGHRIETAKQCDPSGRVRAQASYSEARRGRWAAVGDRRPRARAAGAVRGPSRSNPRQRRQTRPPARQTRHPRRPHQRHRRRRDPRADRTALGGPHLESTPVNRRTDTRRQSRTTPGTRFLVRARSGGGRPPTVMKCRRSPFGGGCCTTPLSRKALHARGSGCQSG